MNAEQKIAELEAELAEVKKLNKILELEKKSLRYRMKAAYRRMQAALDRAPKERNHK